MKNTLQTTARLALESTEEEKHEARNVEVDTMPERISANLRVPDQAQRSRTPVRSVFKDELELTPETVLEQTESQSSWPVLLALQPFCSTNQWEALVKRYLPAHARKVRAGYIRHILDNPFFGRGQKRLTPAGLLGRTDSYSRLPVLLVLREFCDIGEWYRLLGNEWSGCDNCGEYRDRLVAMLNSDDWDQVEQMMTDEERAARDKLPATITAYRGCYQHNVRGLSYSLDRDIAAGFPFLNRYRAKGQPLLITVKMPRSKAIVKLDRKEREVIAIAPRIINMEKLSQGREQEAKAA